MKERLTKDVRYQEFNEVTLDDRKTMIVKGYFIFMPLRKGRFLLFFQIRMPLQWSISCWIIWAVQPVKVLSRVWKSGVW